MSGSDRAERRRSVGPVNEVPVSRTELLAIYGIVDGGQWLRRQQAVKNQIIQPVRLQRVRNLALVLTFILVMVFGAAPLFLIEFGRIVSVVCFLPGLLAGTFLMEWVRRCAKLACAPVDWSILEQHTDKSPEISALRRLAGDLTSSGVRAVRVDRTSRDHSTGIPESRNIFYNRIGIAALLGVEASTEDELVFLRADPTGRERLAIGSSGGGTGPGRSRTGLTAGRQPEQPNLPLTVSYPDSMMALLERRDARLAERIFQQAIWLQQREGNQGSKPDLRGKLTIIVALLEWPQFELRKWKPAAYYLYGNIADFSGDGDSLRKMLTGSDADPCNRWLKAAARELEKGGPEGTSSRKPTLA